MDAIANLDVKHSALAANRSVKLLNAGLIECSNGEIVAHGWLDPASMRALRVDDYQREVLGAISSDKKPSLRKAVEDGASLPDIMIGMRGQDYDVDGNTMVLKDRCYIVDGLQRIAALLHYSESNPDEAKDLRIGAEVRFSTTKEVEKDLFLVLNTSRVPVAPAVILRNLRTKHPAILTLYGLSHTDEKFALHGRVSWNQRMARSELVTALMLAKAANVLHSHQGILHSDRASALAVGLDAKAKAVGLPTFRKNVVEFFNIIDECFGIRSIQYKEVSPQLRGNFLMTLARMFSTHSDFWKGDHLHLDAATKRKLAGFAIGDPEVIRLASAGTQAMHILLVMLIDHMNKSKQKASHLKKRS